MAQVWGGGVLCLLLGVLVSGQLDEQEKHECTWMDPKLGQDLDPKSLNAGATHLAHLREITDISGCKEACCNHTDCQMALVGHPADGPSDCFLLSCIKHGKNVCFLKPNTEFSVYRRKVQTKLAAKIEVVGYSVPVQEGNSTDKCLMSMVVGPCRAAFPRFYYDVTNQTCKAFVYGGCNGNGNNFANQEECEGSCGGVTGTVLPKAPPPRPVLKRMALPLRVQAASPEGLLPKMTSSDFADLCQASPKAGPCRASMRHFYYHSDTGSCKPFTYGGCRGNKNNYVTEEACMKTCTVTVIPSARTDDQTPEYAEACMAPSDPGPCRAAMSMFYFDPKTQSCQSFMYGGCRGNDNRYGTLEECKARCTEDQGEHGHRNSRDHLTPAFFLVATLAVISALLLVSLILITLRRSRLQRRSSLSDKEELLPSELPSEEQIPQDPLPEMVTA